MFKNALGSLLPNLFMTVLSNLASELALPIMFPEIVFKNASSLAILPLAILPLAILPLAILALAILALAIPNEMVFKNGLIMALLTLSLLANEAKANLANLAITMVLIDALSSLSPTVGNRVCSPPALVLLSTF